MNMDITRTTDPRVDALLSRYGAPDACLARLLCDDHPADQVAFTVVEADLTTQDLTYGALRERSERVAAGLAGLGLGVGDRVGVLMGKSADLVVVLLAIWRRGAVHVPLFTAFAPPAIALRLTASDARLVIVDADQRAKLDRPATTTEAPWQVVTVGGPDRPGDTAFEDLLRTEPSSEVAAVGGDAPFALIFTSGTTGAPKGVPWLVRGLAHLVAYLEYGCDVRADDVYWNIADPGWAYGLGFAIVAPLCAGRQVEDGGGRADRVSRPASSAEVRATPTGPPLRVQRRRAAQRRSRPVGRNHPGGPHPGPLRADRAGDGGRQRLAPRRPAAPPAVIDGPGPPRLGRRGAAT